MPKTWHLISRPNGLPTPADFELVDEPSRALEDGEVRVRNRWLSVDPYMRARMNAAAGYAESYALGEGMFGGAVGEIVESRHPGLPVGMRVFHLAGWREEAILAGDKAEYAGGVRPLPDLDVDDRAHLHSLGLTGGTAYFGLLRCAAAKPGDIVFVSAAAGAVGSAVIQIAKAKGMVAIGSAGGPAKCDYVMGLGADACLDYKAGDVAGQLTRAAPDGIDVYFDNVGGEHLDAAFGAARLHARFAICGMIDIYNRDPAQTFRNIARIIGTRTRVEGFLYPDYAAEMPQFLDEMSGWIRSGKVRTTETIRDGIGSTVDAFLGLFSGENLGKMLIRL